MTLRRSLDAGSAQLPLAYAEALLALAEELGVPRECLLTAAGLRAEALASVSGRLGFADFYRLASAALQLCDEPALGLLFGQRLNLSSHGILGYAVLASADLGTAIRFALRYYRVLGLAFDLEVREEGDYLVLSAVEGVPLASLARFAAESLLSSLYAIACFLLGEPPQGVQVGFAHAAPDHAARYAPAFGGADVAFAQAEHCLRLPLHYLQRPMALANPAALRMCQEQCEALLATLDLGEGLLTRLRRLLLARPGEFPDLESAAKALHISGRSLRRHLAASGTRYQAVLDDVRRRLALQYLTTTQLPLQEIAGLLGFSDPSNFRRAFRNWTGRTPGSYRPPR
ncbi:AraC family transcriptional regulator [Pseudomonas kuykendallii]|uniref:AraC family transcriptional regulator n=1 Tax=Pseudomonas kuykendallii TaxID=1007099 RepID=UPI0026805109